MRAWIIRSCIVIAGLAASSPAVGQPGARGGVCRCDGCTERGRSLLSAMRRKGQVPPPRQLYENGQDRRVTGFVLLGSGAALLGASAGIIGYLKLREDQGEGGGSAALAVVAALGGLSGLALAIVGPLVVRSGNKRIEAARVLHYCPTLAASRSGFLAGFGGRF